MSEARAEERTNNGDRGQFLDFIDEYQRADEKVAEAVGDRRELRKRIKEAGTNMPAFDRARKLNGLSDELREIQRQAENRYLEWLGKPLGYQGQMFEDGDDEDEPQPPAPSASQIETCENQARAAAMNGHARETNPWPPETALHAAWDRAWLEVAHPAALSDEVTEALGAENKVLAQRERRAAQRKAAKPAAAAAAAEEAERRPPGRPKGATDRRPRKRRGGHPQAAE